MLHTQSITYFFYSPNNVWRWLQIVKLLLCSFINFSVTFSWMHNVVFSALFSNTFKLCYFFKLNNQVLNLCKTTVELIYSNNRKLEDKSELKTSEYFSNLAFFEFFVNVILNYYHFFQPFDPLKDSLYWVSLYCSCYDLALNSGKMMWGYIDFILFVSSLFNDAFQWLRLYCVQVSSPFTNSIL
jgi:hypothetical protein